MDTSLHAVGLQSRTAARTGPGLNPLALWHLLSLDAPTVATLWTWFLARTLHVALPTAILIAMFLAVWLLYAVDRLLDCRGLPRVRREAPSRGDHGITHNPTEPLEARHIFHHHHRLPFLLAIAAATITLATLIPTFPRELLLRYLGLATLLTLWFAIIHILARAKPLPKELLVGPFFAAAVFIPFGFAMTPPLAIAAVLFALLCTQNCLYIHAWEHPVSAAHAATRLSLRALPALSFLGIALPCALMPAALRYAPILAALAVASALLLGLDRLRHRLAPTTLRAAADLVLLTPILVAPFLR